MSSPSMSSRKSCPRRPPPLVNSISKSNTARYCGSTIGVLHRIEAQQPQPRLGARPVRGARQEVSPAAGGEAAVALDHLAPEHVHVLARRVFVAAGPFAAA